MGSGAKNPCTARASWELFASTFLIGPDGRIARIWPKVKVDGHADEVLAAAKAPVTASRLPRFHGTRIWRILTMLRVELAR